MGRLNCLLHKRQRCAIVLRVSSTNTRYSVNPMKRTVLAAIFSVAICVALLVAAVPRVVAQSPVTPTSIPTATVSPEQILEQAEKINQTASDASSAADRAMNAVNLILG